MALYDRFMRSFIATYLLVRAPTRYCEKNMTSNGVPIKPINSYLLPTHL